MSNFIVWMPTLSGGARSKLFLWTLLFNPYKRTVADQVLWEEVLRWGWAGRKLGTDTCGEARHKQVWTDGELGCSTVLQAWAALTRRSEAGRPFRVVLKYREGVGGLLHWPFIGRSLSPLQRMNDSLQLRAVFGKLSLWHDTLSRIHYTDWWYKCLAQCCQRVSTQ